MIVDPKEPKIEPNWKNCPSHQKWCSALSVSLGTLTGLLVILRPDSFLQLALDALDDPVVGSIDIVGDEEGIDVALGDCAALDHELPIDDLLPVVFTEKDDGKLNLDLPALLKSHDLKELVHSADSPWGNDEGHGLKDHPELASEEIVELKGEVRVDILVQ